MKKKTLVISLVAMFALAACGGGGGLAPTHSISGTVTFNGSGYSGATVALSGASIASTVTDFNGEYSFPDLADGGYTITPALSGQTFTPTSFPVTLSGDDSLGNDFALDTWEISGQVTLNGSPVPDVPVTLKGDANLIDYTDGSGNYIFSGLMNGNYSVEPSSTGQSFTPDNPAVIVNGANRNNLDFAFNTYVLSGQVTLNGSGYQGATVDLGGDENLSTSTNSSGEYSFAGLLNGSYTLTPSLSDQSFTPVNTATDISYASVDSLDFALDTYTVSGQVTYNGAGKSDVAINYSGMSSGAVTTDDSGNYLITGILNGPYTVTPVLYNQVFAPASSAIDVSAASVGNVDFDIPSMIWFVDADSPTVTPDGLSWGTAFMNPQNGSDVAATGDQVWVAKGTYASMDTGDRAMPVLAMKDNVQYYGGFNGTETDLADRDWRAHSTILTGDIGTQGDMSDNTIHVVTGADGAVLDGFTVTKGNAYVSYYNNTDNKGGGMRNVGVSPTVVNCVFLENSAYQNGGGMYNGNSAPSISHCSFIGNFIIPKSGTFDSGGGMGNENATPVVRDCLFEGNSAFDGGGIGNEQCPPLVIDRCVFTGNQASSDGGGIYSELSTTPEVTNCLFQGNSASRWGGGIGSNYSSSHVTNCTFTGNTATDGRGVYNFYNGTPVIYNSILWDGGSEAAWLSAPLTVNYSDVQGGYAGTGNINADPLFIDAANNYYELNSTSPCIDTGDNSAVTTSYDLNGNDRIVDGPDGDLTATVDMGAYEAALLVWYRDADGDGYANGDTLVSWTRPTGYFLEDELISTTELDCDDTDALINPGAVEIPNDGIDQNCNGSDVR